MDQQQADALNRAADFMPAIRIGDALPAIRIGDALVFVYVKPSPSGRPVLRVTVDMDDVTSASAIAEDDHVHIELGIGNDVVYIDHEPV